MTITSWLVLAHFDYHIWLVNTNLSTRLVVVCHRGTTCEDFQNMRTSNFPCARTMLLAVYFICHLHVSPCCKGVFKLWNHIVNLAYLHPSSGMIGRISSGAVKIAQTSTGILGIGLQAHPCYLFR